MSALNQVLDAINHLNAEDPNKEWVEGVEWCKERLYSERMSAQMEAFCPDASDELRIAAHAQHVQRWTSKRSDYPAGKAGYHCWRTELGKMHAELAVTEMGKAGYSEESRQSVLKLLTKQGIKQNQDVQVLEDVICQVFLKYYFMPFAAKHSEEKVFSILKKTWAKMSSQGQQAALKLDLQPEAMELVKQALGLAE